LRASHLIVVDGIDLAACHAPDQPPVELDVIDPSAIRVFRQQAAILVRGKPGRPRRARLAQPPFKGTEAIIRI